MTIQWFNSACGFFVVEEDVSYVMDDFGYMHAVPWYLPSDYFQEI